MTNSVKYQIQASVIPLITVFVSGGYIQTFFSEMGASLGQISIYTSLLSVIQIVVFLANMFVLDRIKNVIKVLVGVMVGTFAGCGVLLGLCIGGGSSYESFMIAATVGLVISVFMSLRDILSYKQVYLMIDMSDYAGISNNVMIAYGTLSIAIGFVISYASSVTEFRYVFAAGLLMCCIIAIASVIILASVKPSTENTGEQRGSFCISHLKQRIFTYFYIPNLLRGFALSAVNVMPLFFIKNISSDADSVSMLVNILSVSAVVGSILYRIVDKKINTANAVLVSCAVMFVTMSAMTAWHSVKFFYVVYFVFGIFYNINSTSIAVYASEIVDYSTIGTYTSVKLITFSFGQAVGAYVIGLIIDNVPSYLILGLCGLMMFVAGLAYKRFKAV